MRIRPILFALALLGPATGTVAQEAPDTDLSILPQACRAAIVPPEQAMPGSDDSHDDMAGAPRPASEAQVSNAGETGAAASSLPSTASPVTSDTIVTDCSLAVAVGSAA